MRFGLAIFCGAFLLFAVQPLIGKYILPWFGGGPAVWTACMLFFQVALLAGYAYAHLITRRLSSRGQAVVHTLLLAAALAMLPIIPAEKWKLHDGGDPTARILLLLAVTVGLPYLALSATGPLLQAWHARMNGTAPYRLYALSNAASLLALLSYPVAVEPNFTRRWQALAWSAGMAGFAALMAWCAWGAGRQKEKGERQNEEEEGRQDNGGWRILWLLLPACASVLLLAITNKMCHDMSVLPFLWVLPLGIYLLSFVICFDNPRWYVRGVFAGLLVAAIAAFCWAMTRETWELSLASEIGIHGGLLGVCCMICHGELYRLRPPARRLTGYYLTIAAGGALGGVLVAVAAPLLLRDYHELPIGIFACCALLLTALFFDRRSRLSFGRPYVLWFFLVLGMALLGLVLRQLAGRNANGAIATARSFYGVLAVCERQTRAGPIRELRNGGITHGTQLTAPPWRRTPISYYGPDSGVGRAMLVTEPRARRRIGVVGLGAGTMAAFARADDEVRFYEINGQVEQFARTYFTFLSDCPGKVSVVIGDARISLQRELPNGYDVLVLDAFSGDAIPVHLLTAEAMALYRCHLAPGGVLALHISNTHLDLAPVAMKLAESAGLHAVWVDQPDDAASYLQGSDWVIMTDDRALLDNDTFRDGVKINDPPPRWRESRLWTDEDTSLFRVLR